MSWPTMGWTFLLWLAIKKKFPQICSWATVIKAPTETLSDIQLITLCCQVNSWGWRGECHRLTSPYKSSESSILPMFSLWNSHQSPGVASVSASQKKPLNSCNSPMIEVSLFHDGPSDHTWKSVLRRWWRKWPTTWGYLQQELALPEKAKLCD